MLHGRRGHGRTAGFGVEVLLAQQDAAAGARQDLHDLALAQHWIARDHDGSALPRREHRDQHLRDVLHPDRDAVAGFDAALLQRDRERVGHAVEFVERQRSIEVVHERRRTIAPRRRAEHLESSVAVRRDRRRHVAIELEPRAR